VRAEAAGEIARLQEALRQAAERAGGADAELDARSRAAVQIERNLVERESAFAAAEARLARLEAQLKAERDRLARERARLQRDSERLAEWEHRVLLEQPMPPAETTFSEGLNRLALRRAAREAWPTGSW
jgi:septal ring factor EnvC (AmiA/AmiB activator)